MHISSKSLHSCKTSIDILQLYFLKISGKAVVVTPFLPRDGGTARTAIQVHAVNLIEIRLGERWQPISKQSWLLV